ncbi:hypothetical protein F511_21270 [Dorcoceras hygrometricum]|uniref:Uncharacterized protein n=1 Tax=Dorcoceras hygrometricum TaxID=472368 RepID=A0A2Z7AY51_9LAMI|nr:hypothetical protein F511_21270 [Dorcoceras hygrometricum]
MLWRTLRDRPVDLARTSRRMLRDRPACPTRTLHVDIVGASRTSRAHGTCRCFGSVPHIPCARYMQTLRERPARPAHKVRTDVAGASRTSHAHTLWLSPTNSLVLQWRSSQIYSLYSNSNRWTQNLPVQMCSGKYRQGLSFVSFLLQAFCRLQHFEIRSAVDTQLCAKAKRCIINLFKRHRFAIANFKFPRLVALWLATGYFFLYDVALSLASGSSIDWFYCSFLLIVMSLLMSSSLSAPAGIYCSSSNLRLFLASVPAGPPSFFSACSWFLSFQLVHYAPAGSTWPPPDYEQLTPLWTSPLLIQLPSK